MGACVVAVAAQIIAAQVRVAKFVPLTFIGARFTCKGGQISCCGWTCRGVALGEMALLEMVGFFSRGFIYKTSRVPPVVVFQYNPDWMGIRLPRMRIQEKVCDNCEWQSAQLVVSKSCTQMGALSTEHWAQRSFHADWIIALLGPLCASVTNFPSDQMSNILPSNILIRQNKSKLPLFLITTNDNAHCELHVSGPDDMWAPELPLSILALP